MKLSTNNTDKRYQHREKEKEQKNNPKLGKLCKIY
jgi:hypothetical protein